MGKIELAKSYTGQDLDTIFFRPITTGPGAGELGIRMLYNMPTPTTLHFWERQADVLQKYTAAGWNGSASAARYQKTIGMQKVKAEMSYSAEDYFNLVYELISARPDVNLQDLSGTQLEDAETELFRQAIGESIRMTMWLGNTARSGAYSTFDGFLKRIFSDIAAGETQIKNKLYTSVTDPKAAETLLKDVWAKSSAQLKGAKSGGNLVYLVTSDIYEAYEDALNSVELEAAYLARQNGREGLFFRGIPLVDLKLGADVPADMPSSFVILTDRRNLAMAVNTADFPGSEVKMWYNPDEMENRQRAVFTAGCDYLLPEMISLAVMGTKLPTFA